MHTLRASEDRPLLRTLARTSAWALLAGVIVLVVSGWGITQTGVIYRLSFGLIDRKVADAIHRAANVPLAVFFLSHVLINIRLAIAPTRRWKMPFTDTALFLIGAACLAIVVYMEYFRLGG